MEDLILSRYTRLFSTQEDNQIVYLVYNSRTNAFVKLSKHIYDTLDACKSESFSTLSPEQIKTLREAKMLVVPGEDEAYVNQCEMKTHLDTFSPTHLSLSLAPTAACNFRCPYCYERSRPNITMEDATIDHLIRFINNHQRIQTLHISWYGGEPLLGFKTLQKIVRRIETECTARLTSQGMVTNGYYFTDEVIDFFKKYTFTGVQITLDGPEEEHNKTRILHNGEGTYQRILTNIRKILSELPKTQVSIRVNIGKNNHHVYPLLYRELKASLSGKFNIYPGFIRVDDEQETRLICDSMEAKDRISFYNNLEKEGILQVGYFPRLNKRRTCVATSVGGYVIGPSGELYKCWNDMGRPDRIVGNIRHKRLTNPTLCNQYMIDGRWTSDARCRTCFFLPICDCGCAWQRLRNKYHEGNYDVCTIYKEKGIEYFLQMYYKKRRKKSAPHEQIY
ncbi:MAG: radical SAM protein [Bacteroides sp.]|nr:radical SAM protein [Bacteroides sp.]